MKFTALLEFFDAPAAASFDQPPREAIAFFQHKGLRETFRWTDALKEEHTEAFTVAKMMDLDLLETVRQSLDDALANGTDFASWREGIEPRLKEAGWWGRKMVTDPATGEQVAANLGSASRLQTIFRTNMQTAYAAGQWQQIIDQADNAPYLMYHAIDDYRTRPAHRKLNGIIRKVTDAFWRIFYPPNGWNCRCSVIQLDDDDLEAMGLTAATGKFRVRLQKWRNPRTGKDESVPEGIDPGWDYNPGSARKKALADTLKEKVAALPAEVRDDARAGVKATIAAGQANPASYDYAW